MRISAACLLVLATACATTEPARREKRVEPERMCRKNIAPSTRTGRFDACYFSGRALLEVTLRVQLDFSRVPEMTPAAREQTRRWAIDEASRFWSGRHRLIAPIDDTGNQRIVAVAVHVVEVDEGAHFQIMISKPGARSNVRQRELYIRAGAEASSFREARCSLAVGNGPTADLHALVHETGHMLGLGDEYVDEEHNTRLSHAKLIDRFIGKDVLWVRNTDARVMSAGLRVHAEHGVVFAEALTRITGANHIRVIRDPPTGPEEMVIETCAPDHCAKR